MKIKQFIRVVAIKCERTICQMSSYTEAFCEKTLNTQMRRNTCHLVTLLIPYAYENGKTKWLIFLYLTSKEKTNRSIFKILKIFQSFENLICFYYI